MYFVNISLDNAVFYRHKPSPKPTLINDKRDFRGSLLGNYNDTYPNMNVELQV